MGRDKAISLLVVGIAIFSFLATTVGIFSKGGEGSFEFTSIHGEIIPIYGVGVYQHMAADVAIQGIAQDFITLFIAIPLLLLSYYFYRRGSFRGRVILTGTVFYFFLTYLFYLVMAMYNELFLIYIALLSFSFFALILLVISSLHIDAKSFFNEPFPYKIFGGFLMYNAISIAFLWLQTVISPMLEKKVPTEVMHYTTLIVQGLDLALFLPISFIAGWYLYKNHSIGYFLAPIYLVFLSILMTALSAKLVWMYVAGANVFPPIIIIPITNAVTIIIMLITVKSMNNSKRLKHEEIVT